MNRSITHMSLPSLLITLLAVASTNLCADVLTIKNNKVGINQPNPTYILHIRRDDGLGAGFRVQTQNAPASFNWYFQQNHVTGAFLITPFDGGNAPLQVFAGPGEAIRNTLVLKGGQVGIGTQSPKGKLDVNGSIVQRGSTLHPDYVFEPSYELESIEDHAAYMFENKHLPAVGAGKYSENGTPILDLGERSQGTLEELEKAHIYIAQLNETLKKVVERLDAKDAQLDALRRQVEVLKGEKEAQDND